MTEGGERRFMGRVERKPAHKTGPLSVLELNQRAKDLIEGAFAEVLVQGELSRITRAASGHVYFGLRDAESRIEAVLWARQARLVSTGTLVEGASVVARGSLTIFPPQGRYQLVVQSLEPAGAGARKAAMLALVAKLREEGLLDPARKKALPFLPRCVGLVTSPTGAAIKDILEVSRRRFPRMPFLLAPTRVQGEGAQAEIQLALERLARSGWVDVIIVGRGGGSMEDLWAFNDEGLARAIAASPVPVISAVGHEIDVTIADLVADRRAHTPSEAAELAVPLEASIEDELAEDAERLARAFGQRLAFEGQRVDGLGRELRGAARRELHRAGAELASLGQRLQAMGPAARLAHRAATLAKLEARATLAFRAKLARAQQRLDAARPVLARAARKDATLPLRRALDDLERRLLRAPKDHLARASSALRGFEQVLSALDPKAVLARGYSITFHRGQPLRAGHVLAAGDTILTRFADGAERTSLVQGDASLSTNRIEAR